MNFWERPLRELSPEQWEALCDGCGNCCRMLSANGHGRCDYACPKLDTHACRCTDYANRLTYERVICAKVTIDNVLKIKLPVTCAYVKRALGQPLETWHPLISGHPESVHRAGISVRGKVIHEP